MRKLTIKTFCVLLVLSLMICFFTYACIWFFLPYAGGGRGRRILDEKAQQLAARLRETEAGASGELFMDFIRETGADVMLLNADRRPASLFTFAETGEDVDVLEGEGLPFRFLDSMEAETSFSEEHFREEPSRGVESEEYILLVRYNPSQSDKIRGAIINSIPFVGGMGILLSFASALLFSYYETRPIIRIGRIADRIARLDFSWYCPDVRDDEIGMLAKSINELSDRLHCALDELHGRNAVLEDEILLEKERERRRMLFFSGVSHELKTPIAVVIGQLEGMQAGVGVYRDRDKYLARSAEILHSLNGFIKEILLVSHMDMGEQRSFSPVSLSGLVEELFCDYAEYAALCSVSLTRESEEDIFAYGDEALLKKAIGNVVENAVAHSPENGTVDLKLARENGRAKLIITNYPAHIDEIHLPHLFEAFYRGNQSVKHGSGLGLYITKMILEGFHIPHTIRNAGNGVEFTAEF